MGSLRIMARMLASVRFDTRRFEAELRGDASLATELADYLVRKGVPFRQAHAAAGAAVAHCTRLGISLADLPPALYRRCHPLFGPDLYSLLDPRHSLPGKKSAGSTSPASVARALRIWEQRLQISRKN
jgi:argininosuccinate lyase